MVTLVLHMVAFPILKPSQQRGFGLINLPMHPQNVSQFHGYRIQVPLYPCCLFLSLLMRHHSHGSIPLTTHFGGWVTLSMGKGTKVTTIEHLTFHGCSSCVVYMTLLLYWVKSKVCDPIVGTSNFTYNISIESNQEFLHPLSNFISQRLSSQVFISN